MAARVHMPLKVIAFDANGFMSSVAVSLKGSWRQDELIGGKPLVVK
jgi:hypothetical protein